MIDMHSHILYDIDDGSKSFAMSCQMIDDAVAAGVKQMFATSHFIAHDNNYSVDDLKDRVAKLQKYIDEEKYDFDIILGHEILIDHLTIDHLESGKALTLGDSSYVLIEFPMYDIPVYTDHVFHELKLAGYIPIIAHPERNKKIIEDPNRLYSLLEKGAFSQLNLKSLTGKFGKEAQSTAEILLRHNMYHFVGSDVHRPTSEQCFMGRERNQLKELVSGSTYDEMTVANPYAVMIDSKTISSKHTRYEPLTFIQQIFGKFRRVSA